MQVARVLLMCCWCVVDLSNLVHRLMQLETALVDRVLLECCLGVANLSDLVDRLMQLETALVECQVVVCVWLGCCPCGLGVASMLLACACSL